MPDPITRLNAALEGRYRVERELGEGGMATVYLADDLRHERNVALKVLKPELAAVVGAERFLAEIKTTANLQHPHILPLFDSGAADGFLFYVMPFVEGETLRDRLDREHQLPVHDAVQIATNVAEGLDYAHRHGVIHRDIKPANILLQDGKPVISDFGIALAVGAAGGGRMTETGMSLGTPHYMSPEQATGDLGVGAATDVYALGCVLYEMLVAEPPYTGGTPQAILGKIIAGELASATKHRPSVPAHVDSAITKALEKVPADRFTSARGFADALADSGFRHGVAVGSGADGATAFWRRTAAAVGVLGIALAAVVLLQAMRAQSEIPSRALYLSLDFGELFPMTTDDVVISPDGSAFVASAFLDGSVGLYYRRADEARFRLLPGTEWGRYPDFSPDGQWIVYRDADPEGDSEGRDALLRIAVDGGDPLTVLPRGLLFNPLFPQWVDDGTIIFQRPGVGVFRIPEVGGEPELLVEGSGSFPRMLPGGRAMLRTVGRSIVLVDFEKDTTRTLVSRGVDALYVETGHILYADPDGGLYALPFELASLEVTGQAVLVMDGARVLLPNAANPRANYSMSRTGTLVVEEDLPPPLQRLALARLEGGLDELPLTPRTFHSARSSPDGRSIVYSSEGDLFLYVFESGTAPRRLTDTGVNELPVWSPDGTRIAYTSVRAGTIQDDLFVMPVTEEGTEEHLFAESWLQEARAWPEEGLIVFDYRFNPPSRSWSNVWMSGASPGTEPRPYIQSEADVDQVAISPDGRWAAYRSDESGTEEVYVRAFPEPGPQYPVSSGGGHFPQWSPDGGTVYYWRAQDAPVDTLLAARVRTDPTVAVLSRQPVLVGDFVPAIWDVPPDGERLLVAQPVSEGAGPARRRFQVIQGFSEVLRRRMGN